MNLRDNSPILICVDLQKKFTDEKYWGGGKYNKDADATCSLILKEWRNIGLDIIHVRQNLESSKSKLNKKIKYLDVLQSIKQRDHSDYKRRISPLKKTKDAILIDTTNLTIKKCFIKIRNIIDEGLKKKIR